MTSPSPEICKNCSSPLADHEKAEGWCDDCNLPENEDPFRAACIGIPIREPEGKA
jgi:predicted amidophosphoribosyltransferase